MKKGNWLNCDQCRKRLVNLRTTVIIKPEYITEEDKHYCNSKCLEEYKNASSSRDESDNLQSLPTIKE